MPSLEPVPLEPTTFEDFDAGEGMPNPVFRTRKSEKPARIQRDDLPSIEESIIAPAAALGVSIIMREPKGTGKKPAQTRTGGAFKPEKPTREPRAQRPARAPREEEIVAPRVSTRAPEPAPVVPFSIPPLPKPVPREQIAIPDVAPQVVQRRGLPTLVRNHKVYPPLFFFGNASDEGRLSIVLEEFQLAKEAGVNIIVHYVELEVNQQGTATDAVSFASYLLKRTLETNPEAQVIFRTVFAAKPGWDRDYPKAKYITEEGGLGEPSFCDEKFWRDAENCLQDFVERMMLLPDAGQVMGVHLERGEWFFPSGSGYDTSPAAQDEFRNWIRMRYRNDNVALCAAWFDGPVQFDTLTTPEYLNGDSKRTEEFVQTGRKSRRWVDYHLFLSDTAVDRITRLAHLVKKSSGGMMLVGVSYGYTFEWSHPGSGHLSLGKLCRVQEIDFIAGPPSYKNREPGGSCPFPGPVDSFALNGKLYISEEDFKTPISGKSESDDFNTVMKTPQALESAHWRGVGAALSHGAGMCWMDLWGNGWLKSPGIWDRAKDVKSILTQRMSIPNADPDVAVLIDERSLAYLVDQRAFELLVQNVRESILRSGLSAGFYLLSDLAHRETFPEAKLYVFLNAWDIRPEVRSAIKTRLQRDGKTLFWMYAAGLFDSGRDALERVREVTGIALKRQPFASKSGTTLVHKKHPLCEALPEKILSQGNDLEPSYFAIPEDGLVLGEYTGTGLPSFMVREFEGENPSQRWRSVFFGEAVVTPALFRALGAMAGAHVWSYFEDLVHVRAPFLTVHCRGAGSRTITLPDKYVAYNIQRHEWATVEGTQLRFATTDGGSHTFLVGVRSEIEAILNSPQDQLLKMDVLPERPANTRDMDDVNFDIPIMKLDALIEETWSDEHADDLVFKPSMMEFEATQFDSKEDGGDRGRSSSNRQRGRRRQGKGNNNRNNGGEKSDFDVAGMSVMFRKRD